MDTAEYVCTGSSVNLNLHGLTCPFCSCVRSHGPAAAGQPGDNLVTSQAEPRLLSCADSGAVRHSLRLGGQGGEREDTERSLGGRNGRREWKMPQQEEGGSGSEPRQNYTDNGTVYSQNMEGQ